MYYNFLQTVFLISFSWRIQFCHVNVTCVHIKLIFQFWLNQKKIDFRVETADFNESQPISQGLFTGNCVCLFYIYQTEKDNFCMQSSTQKPF
jgi:hypothetical protein